MPAPTAPIFIVGANRSGTTLLRLLLNAHPRIAIPEELNYVNSFLANTPIDQWRTPNLAPDRFAAFVDECLSSWASLLPELDLEALRDQILEGPADFRHPYATALRTWAAHHGKPRWGEKTPGNLFYADVLHEMFPEARFILVVRDPRAGVASMHKVDFFPADPVFNALSRHKHMTKGRAILERHVPASQRYVVRYEDLVGTPEQTVRDLCTFLGETYDPSMLAFHRDAEQYMKDTAASSFNTQATRPISTARVEAWRHQLSPDAIAIVETVCRDEMTEFAYVPDGRPLTLRSRIELLLKQGYWAVQNWRNHKIRHYTVKHPIFARTRRRGANLLDWLFSRPASSSSRQ